jgi:hypothetical protein
MGDEASGFKINWLLELEKDPGTDKFPTEQSQYRGKFCRVETVPDKGMQDNLKPQVQMQHFLCAQINSLFDSLIHPNP